MGHWKRWHRRHGRSCEGPKREGGRLQCYVRAKLHRRIFLWFGASILLTGAAVAIAFSISKEREGTSWHHEMERAQVFLAGQFARVWDDPAQRHELAEAAARDLELVVQLEDTNGRPLGQRHGASSGWQHEPHSEHSDHCPGCGWVVPVERDGRVLGFVRLTSPRPEHSPLAFLVVLFVALITIWAASGAIARRIVRPLIALEKTARKIGEGDLAARVDLGHHHAGEVGVVAEAVNEMAERIEKQLADQRELLAAVSHEMRTPLGHMRVLTELARDSGADPATMDDLERELVEADALIDELLASSRLEFAALTTTSLDVVELAERAAHRAGLDAAVLHVELGGKGGKGGKGGTVEADPTLLSRALANLLDNGKKHGDGVTAFRVKRVDSVVRFEVEDQGPGFGDTDPGRIFESFYQGETNGKGNAATHASLGLGLSLVQRIAVAHGGRAGAEGLAESSGARVWIEIPCA